MELKTKTCWCFVWVRYKEGFMNRTLFGGKTSWGLDFFFLTLHGHVFFSPLTLRKDQVLPEIHIYGLWFDWSLLKIFRHIFLFFWTDRSQTLREITKDFIEVFFLSFILNPGWRNVWICFFSFFVKMCRVLAPFPLLTQIFIFGLSTLFN